jgi:hypothetical protein
MHIVELNPTMVASPLSGRTHCKVELPMKVSAKSSIQIRSKHIIDPSRNKPTRVPLIMSLISYIKTKRGKIAGIIGFGLLLILIMVLIFYNAFHPVEASVILGSGLFLWVLLIIYEFRKSEPRPSLFACLGLFGHLWPALLLFASAKAAECFTDSVLVWFIALVVFRYYKTIIGIFFWFRYKPAVASSDFKLGSQDCTVIVPTVGPKGNDVFAEMVTGILVNRPAKLILSTNTQKTKELVDEVLVEIFNAIKNGTSTYGFKNALVAFDPNASTEIHVINSDVSNKREQTVNGYKEVQTTIAVMADDTAIWPPTFLEATLPAFEDEKVGYVGTKKTVRCYARNIDPSKSLLANLWTNYWAGFWNAMGGIYLIRHNFEIRSSNATDGGVFCVSGRTSLIRTCIVNEEFQDCFLREHVIDINLPCFGIHFKYGHLASDDDNFITRWCVNKNWQVKIQYSKDATIETVLGKWPKYPQQCLRWSRTTFRQNPIALAIDRKIWYRWPVTVWTTYLPWLWNAALFWDSAMVYTLTRANMYATSKDQVLLLVGFIGFIYLTKLIKTVPWWWTYPQDFLLYFFPIPAYPLFAYYHSILKVWTYLTLTDTSWAGRTLPDAKA